LLRDLFRIQPDLRKAQPCAYITSRLVVANP
jgi:hypothetical protein